ncbi:MAG: tetratricopeptide repeat protein [Deltaproteobacteria bacterium]|nr:tetratricopeptide repeat protein [Deltaproteobacteria bacterium]
MRVNHRLLLFFVILIAFCLPANAENLPQTDALTKARNNIKENPNSVSAHRVYQNLMNKEAMKEEYARRLKEQGRTAENLYLYARLLSDAEQEKLFTELMNEFPDFPWGYYGLAFIKGKKSLFEEAVKLYEHALAIDPQMVESYYQMSKVYYELSDYAKAIESVKMAVDLVPDNAKYIAYQATYFRLMGDARQAIPLLDKAISIDPENKLALRQKMWAHRDREQYKEVREAALNYLALWPDNYQARLFLCLSSFELFDSTNDFSYWNESQKYFIETVGIDPKRMTPYNWMIDAYSDAGWYVYALYFNQKAFDLLGEDDGEAYDTLSHNIGWIPSTKIAASGFRIEVYKPDDIIRKSGDLSTAEKSVLGENPQAWQTLESVMPSEGWPDVEKLNALIEEFPEFAPAYYNRGIWHLKGNYKMKESLADLEKTVSLNNNWGRALGALAVPQMRLKKYASARTNLKRAYELDPDNEGIQFNKDLMMIFDEAVVQGTVKQLHELRDAILNGYEMNLDTFEVLGSSFEGYFDRDPGSHEIQEAYGDIFAASEKYKKPAIKYYKKAIELGGEREKLLGKIADIESAD